MMSVILMVSAPLGGCFGGEESGPIKEESVFNGLCPQGIANNTWYHYSNATDATEISDVFNGTSVLIGNNAPVLSLIHI